ncbi:MAG: elongation factor G [Planctomycetota bacterium]|nr:MAG: elongation factor G [Planctomycetota bacterium]
MSPETATSAAKPAPQTPLSPEERERLLKIRNIGIMAHIDAGKTTVSERILYVTGRVHEVGEVHDGEATMDYLEDERKRGITITSAATRVFWKGAQLNLIDTPGHVDFTVEVERSLRVLDGAVAVFDGVAGVEAQSETVWRQADRYGVPRICFINKLDRIGADFDAAFESIINRLGANAVRMQVPLGREKEFYGLVDLVARKAYRFTESQGERAMEEIPIPEDVRSLVEKRRAQMVEKLVEVEDELVEKFLDGKEISEEEIRRAGRKATVMGHAVLVFTGAALQDKGVPLLLDAIVDYLPNPIEKGAVVGKDPRDASVEIVRGPNNAEPFAGLAFKTIADPNGDLTFVRVYSGVLRRGDQMLNPRVRRKERCGRLMYMHANKREPVEEVKAGEICAVVGLKDTITGDTLCDPERAVVLESMTFPEPVVSMSLEPKSLKDRDKLSETLAHLCKEDPTFRAKVDEQTEQMIVSGMGELHLDIVLTRIRRDYGIPISVGAPKVAYKQTLTRPVEVEGKHVKQSGGHGQYAVVNVRFQPLEQAEDALAFVDEVKGGAIPRQYIPAVEKGLRAAAESGGRLGWPFVNVQAALYYGKFHEVDSSELAFHVAGELAFNLATQGNVTILEPIMRLSVQVPEEFLGDVIGDLNSRRVQVDEIAITGHLREIRGKVPIAEMFNYAGALRGMTQGRGTFSMEPCDYQPLPAHLAEKLLAEELGKKK